MDIYKIIAIIGCIFIVLLFIVLTSRTRIVKTYDKYMKVSNKVNMTGKELAFVSKNNLDLRNIDFALTKDKLGDAYSPKYRTLILSEEVCNTASLASLTIVAHELGHACQHEKGSGLFFISQLCNKITKLTNRFILPLLIIGLFLFVFKYPDQYLGITLMYISGGLFVIHILNQLLNIPLEYDASKRALKYLKEYNFVSNSEYRKAKKLLSIAAQTYIAGLLDGILIINKKKRKKR